MRTLALGFALFSMFFGAGNLVFPLALGQAAGENNLFAVVGLTITAVFLPLLGLLAMVLYDANHKRFFSRIGKVPGFLLFMLVQVVLGPAGSIPRLFTLCYGTLKPYLFGMDALPFILIACGLVFVLTVRKAKIVDLLGYVLTPLLLASLGAIIFFGIFDHPAAPVVAASGGQSFWDGLKVGYGTLDLLAALLFSKLILGKLHSDYKDKKKVVKQFLKASFIATLLLGVVYGGLSLIASYHAPLLSVPPEELLSAISLKMLGPWGQGIAAIAVTMACLTTAISLVAIFADYVQKDLLRKKIKNYHGVLITLGISGSVALLGFSGIMRMLGPILELCYPGLVVLCVWNIVHKPAKLALPSPLAKEAIE